ncbi:MAG: hypothetical protein HUJ54_11570, partial [Erysipelotrichaceae bacterium]|nr:hypothetical protein [Erysipelotrichaceae bacterium]
METVKQYIDSLFDNLPKTKDVKEAREHLLEMAEDKYSDFKSEGMTAQEAAGRVIAELGTADELREELHLPKDIRTLNPDQEVLKISTLQQMIKDYMTAALLKAGAFACLIGLCLWPAFLWVGQWVAILMILTLTAAIVMFIIRKSIIEKWASRSFSKAVLDPYAEDEIRQEWEARKKQALT